MQLVAGHSETWVRLKNSDPGALLEIYRAHYVGLMNLGMKLSGSRSAVADAISTILLRLWDGRAQLPAIANPRAYLIVSLRHELTAEKRRNERVSANGAAPHTDPGELSHEEMLIAWQTNEIRRQRIGRAMTALSAREQELLTLKYYDDLSYDEIAAKCGISKRTAYNIIHNALKNLKTCLSADSIRKISELVIIFLFISPLI